MDCQATSPLGPTQSDLTPGPVSDLVSWPARRLLPAQRQELAVQVLARASVSQRRSSPAGWAPTTRETSRPPE